MGFLFHFGRYVLMLKNMLSKPEKFNMYFNETMRQIVNIGIGSLVIIILVSFFIGAVTLVQFAYQIQNYPILPKTLGGYVVRESMILELAPTISCLLLAGKVGSNIASELGTMRISEQIDALKIMGVNTTSYLVAPKVFGAVFVVPLLIIISAAVGILGGYVAGSASGLLTPDQYEAGLLNDFKEYGVFVMLVKSLFFAFLITSISCYHGYHVKGGALEIGDASTRAVVQSCIAIVFFDFIIAAVLL
ncbi:MAG: ABC transporter permease [Saprospiraceae bacterium]|nr:ABC transporter permease [Saprospiraceae bacterium]